MMLQSDNQKLISMATKVTFELSKVTKSRMYFLFLPFVSRNCGSAALVKHYLLDSLFYNLTITIASRLVA